MIDLTPLPTARHACPGCGRPLRVLGFYVPGMRCLADLECPPCRRRFFGDLPSGHGLYYPALLDRASGEVTGPAEGRWFADWLRESYRSRSAEPLSLDVEVFRPAPRPLLLNCLDAVYGHALLKLLNAQAHLDRHGQLDLIVLVPRPLRWMVPQGAAEVWTVTAPLRQGAAWSDWLAAEVARRLAGPPAKLSLAMSLPHARDYAIERFTGVTPFDPRGWADVRRPIVTVILREDRRWGSDTGAPPARRLAGALRGVGLRLAGARRAADRERRRVLRFGEALRRTWPELDLAVSGIGEPGGLPDWIEELRVPHPTPEDERAACRRFAASHLVVGVHGSGLLLPSAHAGASIEIAWGPHLGNAFQDVLVREREPRLALFRHRVVDAGVAPDALAAIADSMLRFGAQANRFAAAWNDHAQLALDPYAFTDGEWRFGTAPWPER